MSRRRALSELEAERIAVEREMEREYPGTPLDPPDPRMPGGRLWPWHVDGPVQP